MGHLLLEPGEPEIASPTSKRYSYIQTYMYYFILPARIP